MTEEREYFGACEGCSTEIREGDKHTYTLDGCWLCESCSPMLSDVITAHEFALQDGDWGDLNYSSADEMQAAIDKMKAEVAESGDRCIAAQ